MGAEYLDGLDPHTGEVLWRAERRRGGLRTPHWVVVWKDRMEKACEQLGIGEEATLGWLIRQMHWGNLVELGAWDVARRFRVRERTARKWLRTLVQIGALTKYNKNLYKVSLDLAWRGKISDWHKHKAEEQEVRG